VDEALRQLDAARRSDPQSDEVNSWRAFVLLSAGRYDEAIDLCRRVLAKGPDKFADVQYLARALVQKGQTVEALQSIEGVGRGVDNIRGYTYAITGRREEAQALALSNAGFPGREAWIYLGLGDKDRAFEALNAMVADNDIRAAIYLTYPEFASLRSDPRATALRAKLHLPPAR
jgi:Flp pilus assembly protein TadD